MRIANMVVRTPVLHVSLEAVKRNPAPNRPKIRCMTHHSYSSMRLPSHNSDVFWKTSIQLADSRYQFMLVSIGSRASILHHSSTWRWL